jgi:SAM-dependent methyltransferase
MFLSENFQVSINDKSFINNYLKANPNLWTQFMNTFPLDQYATALGEFLINENLLNGSILELGAGVGNTSQIVYPHIKSPEEYRRTDINILLLRSSKQKENISFYNFDSPGKWNDQDLIFATNALHCATDKTASFRNIYKMLKKDGHFIICEGAPETSEGVPWALNFACGYFDGWWDKGGFISSTEWINTFETAGFKSIKLKKIMAGDYHLGNIIWGQK